MNEFILYEKKQNILVIKFNRPPDNFIKLPVLKQLSSAIEDIGPHTGYEGLILTSAISSIFISGHEIVDLAEGNNKRQLKKYLSFVAELLLTIQRLPIPTVVLINGHCVGFGLELALAADFRIVSDDEINIGFPDVRLGTFPPFGGIYRLVQLIGEIKAKELLLKGKLITPQSALELGLIDAVVNKNNLLEEGIKLLKGLSRHAPLATTTIKRAIVDATLKDFIKAVQKNIKDYTLIVDSDDYSEGKKALRDGRTPVYKRK